MGGSDGVARESSSSATEEGEEVEERRMRDLEDGEEVLMRVVVEGWNCSHVLVAVAV